MSSFLLERNNSEEKKRFKNRLINLVQQPQSLYFQFLCAHSQVFGVPVTFGLEAKYLT